MKKLITYSILAAITLLTACRKDDNPKIPTLARVPVPNLTKDPSGAGTIVPSTIASFIGQVKVDVYFKTDVLPKKMDLVVIKNGNKSVVKTLKTDITSFPTVVSFTGPQLLSLFGTVVTCDFFEVGVNITTQDGTVYEAFPAVGTAYGSGVAGQYTGVQATVAYNTKVEYDPSIYVGNFVVTKDLWADMTPGDVVVLTNIDATHFSFKYNPYPETSTGTLYNALPIIVTVDPATLTPSIALQAAGSGWIYDNSVPVKVQTTASANNNLSPCLKTLSLNLNWTQGTGSYTGYVLQLKKQ